MSMLSLFTMTVSRNSSTESVFHLSMARVSATSSSSSSSWKSENMSSKLTVVVVVSHLDDGIGSPHILDGEAGVPARSLALDKSRDLRVGPQSSSAHLQDGLLVLGVLQGGGAPVTHTTLQAILGNFG